MRRERVQESLLHLEDALRRQYDVVLSPLVDVVVDLDEFGLPVPARSEVYLPGVVLAVRYRVELRETDVR